MEKKIHVLISGKVQGVWYRASTQKKALSLGLHGWVRNLKDGRVEMVAQGEEAQLQALLVWCKRGPELARVKNLDVQWSPTLESLQGFSARPTVSISLDPKSD
jgi:acylphosphatase